MLEDIVTDIADQLGVTLTTISLVEGQRLGCIDTSLLNLGTKGHVVSTLIYNSDLAKLLDGSNCDRLELRIRTAIAKLHTLLEQRASVAAQP